jgi:hypothetical protein
MQQTAALWPFSCATSANKHFPGEPTNRSRCWFSCRLSVTKKMVLLQTEPTVQRKGFFCEQNLPIKEDVAYPLGWLSVIVCTLVQSKAPFSDPSMSCGTPCYPPNYCWLVAVLPLGSVILNFEFLHAFFYGGGVEAWQICGNRWELLQQVKV